MVREQASASTASSSSSCSWMVRDEGSSRLWQYRVCHSISGTGTDGKKAKRNPRTRRRTNKKTTVEKETSSIPSPNATDDAYYLRWNPTGDYDSDDDDWWNEVMALERDDHHNDREKEKQAAVAAARAREGALYLRYKYHTTEVIKWGDSSWADRYGGQNGKGDGGENHLSLRTVIWRLNDLAHDGVAMPPVVYRNLEHAIELREEFQTRVVSDRRRRKRISIKPSASLSSSPKNSISDISAKNIVEIDETGLGIPKNTKNNETTKDNETYIMTSKQNNHKWILQQLKALLNRFQIEPSPNIILSDHKYGDRCGVVLETKASRDSENSCGECSRRTVTESRTTEKCPFDNNSNSNSSARDKNFDECTLLHPGKEVDVATTILSSCMPSSMTSVPSSIGDDNQCIGQSSISSSTVEDWDELFGDDGSLIGESHESCDHHPQMQDLEIVLSLITHHIEDKSQNFLSNPKILNGDGYFGNNETNAFQKSKCAPIKISQDIKERHDNNQSISQFSTSDSTVVEDWDKIFGDDGSFIGRDKNCDHRPQTQDLDIVLSLTTHHTENNSQNLSNTETLNGDGYFGKNKTNACQKPKTVPIAISQDIKERHDNNQHTSRFSTSNSTVVEDWDKIFGDDGSFIGSDEKCNHRPQTQDLDIVLSLTTHHTEEESQNLSKTEILNRDCYFGSNKTDLCQMSKTAPIAISPDIKERYSSAFMNHITLLSNPSNNSVQRDFPPRNHNDSSTDNIKSKGFLPKAENISGKLDQQKPQRQMIESQSDGTAALERPSTSNNVTIPTADGTSSERVRQPKQYGSVWGTPFQGEEETSVLANAGETPMPIDWVSLANSDPPEDWEMLLEDEEEDTPREEDRSRTVTAIQDREPSSDAALRKELGVCKIELSPRERIHTEKQYSNNVDRQDISDQVFVKLTKASYVMTENLRYDSVWDIFSKDKTSIGIQVADTNGIARSAISIIQNAQPEDDWEALYS